VRDVELGVGVRLGAAERVEVRDQVPADPVHVDQLVDRRHLLVGRGGVTQRALVGVPSGWLVGDLEAAEDLVVEAVLAEEELVDPAEELAALRAADDAVVVGVGQRRDRAHAELGDQLRIGALVLGPGSRWCRRPR